MGRSFIVGTSVVLWAWGTWWLRLLVLFGLWRHWVRRYPLGYEPRLWSMVFPLGMYTVASYTLGRAVGFGFMVDVAQGWVFVGATSWVTVLALMLFALFKALASRWGA